jgi:predicted amidohydrolase
MIVSPWGEVIANAGEGEGYILADLQIDEIDKVRARLDVRPKLTTI